MYIDVFPYSYHKSADANFEANRRGFVSDIEKAKKNGAVITDGQSALYHAINRKATHINGTAIDGMMMMIARDHLANCLIEQGL